MGIRRSSHAVLLLKTVNQFVRIVAGLTHPRLARECWYIRKLPHSYHQETISVVESPPNDIRFSSLLICFRHDKYRILLPWSHSLSAHQETEPVVAHNQHPTPGQTL